MVFEAAIRRVLYKVIQVYRRFFTPISLGCRALIVDDGKVLLVRHTYQDGWYLPGGTVERGESLRAAVLREVTEECALVAKDAVLIGMYFSELERRSDHIALFSVQGVASIVGSLPDSEIAECKFFPIDDLPQAASPATRRRIAEVLLGEERAERW